MSKQAPGTDPVSATDLVVSGEKAASPHDTSAEQGLRHEELVAALERLASEVKERLEAVKKSDERIDELNAENERCLRYVRIVCVFVLVAQVVSLIMLHRNRC